MEKYYDKVSLWSKLINYSIRFTNAKTNSDTVEGAKKYIEKLSTRQNQYNLPYKILKKEFFNGIEVYYYNGDFSDSNKKLLYIHGGSYIEEASYFQIKFAMEVAKKTNSTLILPRYPLAPRGSYKTMYPLIDKLYEKLLEKTTDINFLGDSAGGGFILSFAMYLRDNQKKLPENIIMLSPWLDISMSNPEIYEDAKIDYMCGVDGNRYDGILWANGLELDSFMVSPIYGDFNNLSKMTIIVGENEIFKSECLNLSKRLTEENISHNFIMYKGQGHDFGAYPTKEGKMVILDIAQIINDGVKQ